MWRHPQAHVAPIPQRRRAAAPGSAPPPPAARGGQPVERIPGTPRVEEGAGGAFGFLFRPSGVAYVVSSDGMLHVLGLPSGKDMQKPAQFVPANSRWSAPIAVGTTMYTATSGNCGGAPSAVWAIDLDSDAKPVVSWKTNGGDVVGAVAFMQDGTLVAAIGAGKTTGDGKASAIVALDAKTLQPKDWFTQPDADFVTGPTILRHDGKEIVAAATRDGRVVLLDAASLGGANHSTPLFVSKTVLGAGATVGADALAAWQESGAPAAPAGAGAPAQPAPPTGTPWILVPVAGRIGAGVPPGNGAVSTGAVVALKLTGAAGALSLAPGWVSHDLSSPSTPLIVNGVVFALATGVPATPTGKGGAAVLHAYDGDDRQAALGERQGDDDVRVARQLLERAGAGLRRDARRHAPRVRLRRRAARDHDTRDEVTGRFIIAASSLQRGECRKSGSSGAGANTSANGSRPLIARS